MNKVRWTIPVVVIIILILFLGILFGKRDIDLVKQSPIPGPTDIPVSAPKQYKFDGSTDLKKELDLINPQVLKSDFE